MIFRTWSYKGEQNIITDLTKTYQPTGTLHKPVPFIYIMNKLT